jgi:outer membrane protein TolC
MKPSRLALPLLLALATLAASCVDVDKDVAATPQEYWQPVDRAKPAEPLMPPALTGNISGQELTLPDLIDLALANNPMTRAAWYNAKQAASRLGETNSQYYPQVTANISADRDKVRTVGVNGNALAGTTYLNSYGPSIEINYVLWNFGKNYAQTEAARQALYAADFQYNQEIEDVMLQTELAYFNFDAAEGFVEAAQATLDDANVTYKAANQRLNVAGLGTKQEERQAFAQVQNAEYQLELAQAQVETTRAQLAQSLGVIVTGNLHIKRTEQLDDSAKLDENMDNLMAAAMRQRPDLMAAYANVLQAQYNVSAAKDDQMPVLSAVASASYSIQDAGVTHGNPANNYLVGLVLSWQLFTGFEKTYAILNAQEQADAARETLRAQELKVVTDVWNFYYSYKSALRQVDSTKAQEDAQNEAYKAIQAGYNAGINNYVDLQTALSNLATARQQKVQAEANLGASIANLAHATGRMPLPSGATATGTGR